MSKKTNPSPSQCHQYLQRWQQGKVSLQNIFWVVGIIVGLLSIAQFVLNHMNNPVAGSATVNADTPAVTDGNAPKGKGAQNHITEPTSALTDSPSIKVGQYTAFDNGVVVDDDLGIMWMRCSLGQQWDGEACIGSADSYSLDEVSEALAQINKVSYAGFSGWQVPDIEALHSLLYCSEGYTDSYEIPVSLGAKQTVKVGCTGNYIKPAIKSNVFPNTQWAVWRGYWSSSRNEQNEPLVLYFNTGKIEAKNGSHYVRAMRSIK